LRTFSFERKKERKKEKEEKKKKRDTKDPAFTLSRLNWRRKEKEGHMNRPIPPPLHEKKKEEGKGRCKKRMCGPKCMGEKKGKGKGGEKKGGKKKRRRVSSMINIRRGGGKEKVGEKKERRVSPE